MKNETKDYIKIFTLIDKLNNRDETAEQQLIDMGIYNNEGDMITYDTLIIKYYEENWC